jgi:hypothetical protein
VGDIDMTTEPRRSEDKGGIWQGIAAVITAVGGFLIVLHQIGLLPHQSARPSSEATPKPVPTTTAKRALPGSCTPISLVKATDQAFYEKHPNRKRIPIQSHEKELSREWLSLWEKIKSARNCDR